jgi:hypothetical protein
MISPKRAKAKKGTDIIPLRPRRIGAKKKEERDRKREKRRAKGSARQGDIRMRPLGE